MFTKEIIKGVIIINSRYWGKRDLLVVPKPVVIFYQTMKTLVGFYGATKTFCHKSLRVWGTKLASIIDKTRNYNNVCFFHTYYELINILFIYCTHTHTHTHTFTQTNLKSIYTNWNYLIKGIPNIISRNKGELSKPNNQK